MKYGQFSDTSSILDDYVLIQNPNSPSVLVKKTESTGIREEKARHSIWARYGNANKYFYCDNQKERLAQELLISWKEALFQMRGLMEEIFDSSHLNPAIEATSKRAFLTTLSLMVKLFAANKVLPCPDIVPSGDGGIDVEWAFENIDISVQIHKSNPINDKIYYKDNGSFKYAKITIPKLLALLEK